MRAKPSREVAPLRNIGLLMELIDRVAARGPALPGMACFYGHSGYGKSTAATFAANRHSAHVVTIGDTWTRRTLCEAVLTQTGASKANRTLPQMMRAICDQLMEDPTRPLIIDEADYAIRKNMVDLIREMHDETGVPIIWIGEELLPVKLEKFERAHNRMLDWVAALPCDHADARHLAKKDAPGIDMSDDLIDAIVNVSGGRARRISTNFNQVREAAVAAGKKKMSLSDWGSRPFFSGEPPRRRAA